jgi:hypothetical protein
MLAHVFRKRRIGLMDWTRPPAGTSIRYRLSTASPVILKIYDSADSGIYYYRLFMSHSAVTGRIVLSGFL